MNNVNVYIKEHAKELGKKTYVAPDIPEKKRNNAAKAFKCEDHQSILAIHDNTLFGAADEGLVFTGTKMILKAMLADPIVFLYDKIKSAKHEVIVTVNKKGKEETEEYIEIITKDDKQYKLNGLTSLDCGALASLLTRVIETGDFKDENQLETISNMPEALKVAYLKIIINMTFSDDETVDQKELAELFLLMTRLELKLNSRFEVREYIASISKENTLLLDDLFDIISNNCEASLHESVMISLVKDLSNTYLGSKLNYSPDDEKSISDVISECLTDFRFIKENKEHFNLTSDKVDLTVEAIKTDYENLWGTRDDGDIKKSLKELSAKAAAAGTPLAAIYISGSVVGMSAAGITSGLATLGMGMGMTGGIAVVAVIGVLSYKGMKHLTGANELDKYKTKEMMLLEVLKQTQKTISLIIDDINYIVQKLNEVIQNHAGQTEKINKLMTMVAQFQGALKSVDSKNNQYKNSANRLQCPKVLDEKRLKSLTGEPTKKGLYAFVVENYEERITKTNNKEEKQFALKQNVETDTLDEMAKIFKTLGYFDMDNILKGKAFEGLDKVKGALG